MQAKGFLRTFIIVLLVVCIGQLTFTLVGSLQENKAEKYALGFVEEGVSADSTQILIKRKKQYYLDSIKNEVVLDLLVTSFTYDEIQDQQLSLGLDLKGGMSLLLEIDQASALEDLSYNSKDVFFNAAIDSAKARQAESTDDFITAFGKEYSAINPDGKIAAIFAPIEDFKDKISWESSNEDVLDVLRDEIDATIDKTFNVLNTRIDQFGVAQPNINLQQNGRITIELPGVENAERVRKILQQAAVLEFYSVYKIQEIDPFIAEANEILKAMLEPESTDDSLSVDDTELNDFFSDDETDLDDLALFEESDSVAADTGEANIFDIDVPENEVVEAESFNPLFDVFYPSIGQNEQGQSVYASTSYIGVVPVQQAEKAREYFSYEEVKAVFPRDLVLLWSAKPDAFEEGGPEYYKIYAIQKDPALNEAPLTGDVIIDAYRTQDELGQPAVGLTMNGMGADKWQKMTGVNFVETRAIAIVLDNKVFSAPVPNQEIAGGRSTIDGMESIKAATDLANILKSGKLEVNVNILQEATVGPTLGKASIRAGLLSLAIGLALVLLFMAFYYNSAGLVANIALIVNLVFILGALASLNASLTLPGMAGIVLTIGMAVDANVIIFERIREELRKGKGVRLAISDGFNRSYAAILDANITTLIAGVILLWFGLGPVKGFATVLVIGIISSLISAVLMARLIFEGLSSKDKKVSFSTSITENILTKVNVDFLSKRKITYVLSGLIIAAGIASMVVRGFELGVDFQGGRSYIVAFDQEVQEEAIRASLAEQFDGIAPVVKRYDVATKAQIITSYEIGNTDMLVDSIITAKLYTGLQGFYQNPPDQQMFAETDQYIESVTKVETAIADDIKTSALWGGFLGGVLIFLYILFRFKKWQFGAGALSAVTHDILIILGLFSIFHGMLPFSMEIEQKFIAALLTIIGYSINDTVVVFDRIREFLAEHPTRTLKENVNAAINSTLSRTLMTSFTTLLVVAILFVFGGEAIRGFSFALLIGIVVGTYSSIFVASPIAVDTLKEKKKKK